MRATLTLLLPTMPIKEASEKLLVLKYYKTQLRAAEGRAEGILQRRASLVRTCF